MKRALTTLSRWQREHPARFLVAALLICLGSLPLILELGLNGDLAALLPESTRSVRDMRSIRTRFTARQTFSLLVWSEDHEARRRFVTDLVPRLRALEEEGVLAVDWSLGDYSEFVRHNRTLFAPYDDLVEARDALEERRDYEACRANPFCLSLDDEPPDLLALIEERQGERRGDTELTRRYPDGLFAHPDGRSVSIFLRTDIGGGDNERMLALIAAVQRVVEASHGERYAEDLRVEYGGNVLEMREEVESLAQAAILATTITLILIMGAILVFFRKARALLILPLGMLPAVALTFAFAELTVDFLNASSAFLSSIVIGNGVNSHIIWLARYFELRRKGEAPEEASAEALRSTWTATLSAAAAAGIAYASLTVTDFRAFRDFGIIGGIGMMLCWLSSILLTPTLTTLWDRYRPLFPAPTKESSLAEENSEKSTESEEKTEKEPEKGNIYGRALAMAAFGAPRVVLVLTLLLSVGSVYVIYRWVAADPIEYDFRNLRSERPEGPLQRTNRRINQSVPAATSGGVTVVMAASPEDAEVVRARFEEIRGERPRVFGQIRSIHSMLPTDQERKIPVLREIRQLMLALRRHADPATQARIDENLPPEDLRVLGPEDLPETVARPYIEQDGRRGSVIFVANHGERNATDGRYLMEVTEAARLPTNRDGSAVAVTGTATVMADLVAAILRDGPKAVGLSFVATVILLLLTFSAMRARALTLASHLVGIVWMVALMAALGMKLNFLNFVALPITFGNGVDYGVNVMRRYFEEQKKRPDQEAVRASIRETGGAVILCSMTTIIGYMALYASPNQAVNSFGAAMSISEITCVAAAVIALPAALFLLGRREREPEQEPSP